MSTKNARTLGLRLDATDEARLSKFENETHIEGVSLARASLKAALTAYETSGSLNLPLKIISQEDFQRLTEAAQKSPPPSTAQSPAAKKGRFVVKELIVPDRSTTVLNEGETDAQREIESLQRRLDELTKENGSKTR